MKDKLNILIISDDKSGVNSGKSDPVLLCKKLERDGFNPKEDNFTYLAWSNTENQERLTENIQIFRIKDSASPILRDFVCPERLFAVVDALESKPNVVVVYDSRHLLHALYVKRRYGGIIAEFLTNLPVGLSKTRPLPYLRSLYYFFFERIFCFVPDAVFVINETTKDYALKTGIKKEKVRMFSPNVIRNEIDIASVAKEGRIREKFNIDKRKKIILSVGRLEKEKGYESLIRLFTKMDDPSMVLVIVGDGKERAFLEQLAQKYILENRIIFAGFVEHRDVWDFYKDADLFVLLSVSEALGLVFWEAMYMGVPVLGTRTGGILETIGAKQERGLLVEEVGNLIEFKNKIHEALEGELRESRLLEARKYVLGKMEVSETADFLRSLLIK